MKKLLFNCNGNIISYVESPLKRLMIFMLKIKCNINFNVHVFCLISKEKKINCLMHDRKQRENSNSERVFTNIRNVFE